MNNEVLHSLLLTEWRNATLSTVYVLDDNQKQELKLQQEQLEHQQSLTPNWDPEPLACDPLLKSVKKDKKEKLKPSSQQHDLNSVQQRLYDEDKLLLSKLSSKQPLLSDYYWKGSAFEGVIEVYGDGELVGKYSPQEYRKYYPSL